MPTGRNSRTQESETKHITKFYSFSSTVCLINWS